MVSPLSIFPTATTLSARLGSRLFPHLTWRMPDRDKTVYLTFDDGPTRLGTPRILDLLDRYDVPATFFLIGKNAEIRPDLVETIQKTGHTAGQHTYSHPNAWHLRSSEIEYELARGSEAIEQITGKQVRCMRPPYGRFTSAMVRWCQKNEQRIIMWDVMPGDYVTGIPSRTVEKHVLRYVRPGSIIVLHDNERVARKTPIALGMILDRLKNDGWSFATL